MSRLGGLQTVFSPNLAGGISQQPPPLRFPGQLQASSNMVSSITDGASKRPGTRYIMRITSGVAGTAYRVHPIERDESEKYIVVHGNESGTYRVRAYRSDGSATATISISSDAQAYLNSGAPTPDDIVFRTVQDTTFIVNRKVTTACASSPTYAVTGSARNFGILTSLQPSTQSSYWRTEEDDEFAPRGFYQYLANNPAVPGTAGNVTYGQWQTNTITGGWASPTNYLDSSNNRDVGGFRVFFQQQAITGAASSWTPGTRTLVHASLGSSLLSAAGRHIYVTAGTGWTPGYYLVESHTAGSNTCVLASGTIPVGGTTSGASAGTNVPTLNGWGWGVQISVNFKNRTINDMHDVAKVFEKGIADAGAVGATVYWQYETSTSGRFTIVGPYAESNGSVKEPIAPLASAANFCDYSASTRPFENGTETAGTGSSTSGMLYQLPEQRWTRVPAPSQPNAVPTASTLPVIMQRTSANNFSIGVAPWASRTSGDDDSNPAPAPLDGLTIEDVCLFNNRLCILAGPWIAMSSSEDLYNFFIVDAANLVESDRITIPLGDEKAVKGQRLLPMRRTLIIFTRGGGQYELYADKALTPTSAAITPSTSDSTLDVDPAVMGNAAYYVSTMRGRSALVEYPYTDGVVSTRSSELTTWVPDLLPSSIRTITADNVSGTIFILPSAGNTIYTYKAFFSGEKKELSAWNEWTFNANNTIRDVACMGGDLYLYVETPTSGQWVLERCSPERDRNESGINFPVHLDRMMTITGSHSAGTTTWTFPPSLIDTTINTVVHGTTGQEIAVTSSGGGNAVSASGNFPVSCYVGRSFAASMTPTRPYRRDDAGRAATSDRMTVYDVNIQHRRTGQYTVTFTWTHAGGSSSKTATFSSASGTVDDHGNLHVTTNGDASNYTLTISDTSARPMTITGIEYTVQVLPFISRGIG